MDQALLSAIPALLSGVNVLVLGDEPAVRAGRVLGDAGAEVIHLARADAPLAADTSAWMAWTAGMHVGEFDAAHARALALDADVVIDAPHLGEGPSIENDANPQAVWIHITPFGLTGPRSHWRASDLGMMAASGNLYPTGYPDRAPIRPTAPTSAAHVAGEAAFAAVMGLLHGGPVVADVSVQECVMVASMAGAGRAFRRRQRGQRSGASIGRTREIWPVVDGYVSFGIRGGKAREASMRIISELVRNAGIDASSLDQDWSTWNQNDASDDELAAIEAALGALFARHTMQSLYDIACSTNLMLAPANSPREIVASEQLTARGFFREVGAVTQFPSSFAIVDGARPLGPSTLAVRRLAAPTFTRPRLPAPADRSPAELERRQPALHGVNILEFGSGAAGPIATRYFAEHGATVLRIESRTRPDFLRAMALGPGNPHGLEGSDMYDALNCAKRNLSLNLKHPEAVAIARRLVVEWADAVAENYAPKAMKGFGLDYQSLRDVRPDVVMISACLNGQTGPHRDYPGFGGQGSALSGWNWVTGWPDREPVGPYGTITDSLAPRYVAALLGAALLYRQRTGNGCAIDVSQVEVGAWALSPWLLDFVRDGHVGMRNGNRSNRAVPHGVFPCADESDGDTVVADRWVAIACHDDAQWRALAAEIGWEHDGQPTNTLADRESRIDDIEAAISAWTRLRSRDDVATRLQDVGVEAVPVSDFVDLLERDPQLAHRSHFAALAHPVLGPGRYERNGIRFDRAASGYDRSGPTLGQDNAHVLTDVLGLDRAAIESLRDSGALE